MTVVRGIATAMRGWRRWAATVLAATGCVAAAGGVAATAAATAATPNTATFTLASDWGSGFVGRYVLHNDSARPITGWRLDFDLPAGERLTSAWNAVIARSDQHYVLTPVSYTKTIAAGASLTIGFEGAELAPFAPPTGCLLDGLACDGSSTAPVGASGASKPTVPSGLAVSSRAPNSVTLHWNPSSDRLGVTSYDVYRGTVKVATVLWPTATISGLQPNTKYRFSVRAVDAGGNVSAPGASLRVKTSTPAPELNSSLTATYTTVNDWGTGYVGAVIVHNLGASPVIGWQLTLGLPAGATLDSAWNAQLARTGSQVTLTPSSWTRTIPRGGSVYVGFQGVSSGSFPGPAACKIDGAVCATTQATPIGSPPSTTPTASVTPARGSGSGATAPSYAPYVDMTLSPALWLGAAASAGHLAHATLAFVISDGGCQASWGGATPLDDPLVTSSLADLRAAGGSAIVSFGGHAGQELAQTCATVGALAAQYQTVVDQYAIRDLDFDIEGAAETDVTSLTRRAQAIALLQATGRAAQQPVHVSFTLPVTPTGLDTSGLRVLRNAIANGVDVGTVNLMAMDYYNPKLVTTGRMGALAIAAAEGARRQLKTLYPHRSATALWKMLGITAMLGINDDPKEIFTTADAAKVATFARQRHLGRLSLWSANRDTPCARPEVATDNLCSGVTDPAWAFSKAFATFPSG